MFLDHNLSILSEEVIASGKDDIRMDDISMNFVTSTNDCANTLREMYYLSMRTLRNV